MSDPSASALGGGVASRFVSSTALDEAKAKRVAEMKAAYERIGEQPPTEAEDNAPYDPRSLYEKLQDQKNQKQEKFDEQLKFKNQFRALDEDEIDFLDTMIDENNEEEKERQRQIKEELNGFKAAVLRRTAAPPPASAYPPLPHSAPAPSASISTLPSSSTASSVPSAAKPKPLVPPKKGKRKSLPGLVVGKKKSAAALPVVKKVEAVVSTVASAGASPQKRKAEGEAEGEGASPEKRKAVGDGEEGEAKKRRTEGKGEA